MPIEWDARDGLPGLSAKEPPLVSVEALMAVADVRLAAGDVPRGILREFYEGVAGVRFVEADEQAIRFVQDRRQIVLERGIRQPGRVGFVIKQFVEVLLKLRGRGIAYEELHTDGGLTRMVILHDPAGNWVFLIETRPF